MTLKKILRQVLNGVGFAILILLIYSFLAVDSTPLTLESIKVARDELTYSDLSTIKQIIETRESAEFKDLQEFNEKYSQKVKAYHFCYYLSGSKSHFVFATVLESKKYKKINKGDYLIYDSKNLPITLDSKITDYINGSFCD